jgi:hypothetical protein
MTQAPENKPHRLASGLARPNEPEFTRPSIAMSTKEYIKTFKLSLPTP